MQILQEHISAIHGGSNPASMRDTVFGGDTQSMPLNICVAVEEKAGPYYAKKLNLLGFFNHMVNDGCQDQFHGKAHFAARYNNSVTARHKRVWNHI